MKFALFLLVNAMLYIRPAEFSPALLGLPIYEACILSCLAAAHRDVLRLLSPSSLAAKPLNACVVALLPAIILSRVANLEPVGAFDDGLAFFKVLLYFLLMVAVVDTPKRLERLLTALTAFAMIITATAVLHYYKVIDVPALRFIESPLDDSGSPDSMVVRLGSTGLFQDPNDMCLMLVMAMILCLYQIVERRQLYWAGPLLLFGNALRLTHSRGGLLGLLAALGVLTVARFGKRRAIPLVAVGLPVVLAAFAGRQTSFGDGMSGGTGSSRIELWSDGLTYFLRRPLFGTGSNTYADYVGHVAHNSFIHAFVELGMVGGTLFLGAFYLAVWPLVRLGGPGVTPDDLGTGLTRMRPYVLAVVSGYAAGLASLSCCYLVPTYAVLGLSATYINLAEARLGVSVMRWSFPLARRLAWLGTAFIVSTVFVVRVVLRPH